MKHQAVCPMCRREFTTHTETTNPFCSVGCQADASEPTNEKGTNMETINLNDPQLTPRPMTLYPEEQLALDRGADVVLILDRPGLVPPTAGDRLLGYTGRAPDPGRLYEVLESRLTTIDGITDAEADAIKANDEKFIPWLIRMMGDVLWSPETKIHLPKVRAVTT